MTSIISMAGLLHPPSAKARVIVALRAYFDESGTHTGGPMASDAFVLGGYIAPESLWDDKTPNGFLSKWNAVMHGKPFHATEMESNPQGPTVKVDLANVVNKSGVIGIRSGISVPAFKRLLLPHIKKLRSKEDNPYFFLFADVICETVRRADIFLGENKDEPIGFVFAEHKKWALIAHEMYEDIKADREMPVEVITRMGAVAFDPIEKFVPLQAADHLAFESFHRMTDLPGTSRPAMNLLMNWPQNFGTFYDEKGLLKYIELCKKEGIL